MCSCLRPSVSWHVGVMLGQYVRFRRCSFGQLVHMASTPASVTWEGGVSSANFCPKLLCCELPTSTR